MGKVTVEASQGLDRKLFASCRNYRSKTRAGECQVGANGFGSAGGEHWSASELHVHMNYGALLNDPQRLARMAEAEGVEIFHDLTG